MTGQTEHTGSILTPQQRRRLTRRPSDGAMIAVLTASGLIAAFMQTLVVPIIPHLPELLDTTTVDAQWVLTSTLLAAAISTPISGRLGDMYGKRRMVLALLAILVLGSIISALSVTLIPMLVGRTLQGISLGVIALGISVLRDVIHPKNLAAAVALVSATLGVGGAVGLPIAAVIAQNFDWHLLFWMAAILGFLAFFAVLTIIPVSTLRTGGRFDFIGAIGLAVGLICILLAISKGTEWGWTSPLTLGLLGGGVLVLIAWGVFELRTASPLVDLRVSVRRAVLFTNLASISVGFAFFVTNSALPVLLETTTEGGVGLGQTLIVTSLCLMPGGLAMFFVSGLAARLSTAKGPRTSLILGTAIIAAAFAAGPLLMNEVWQVVIISTVVGIGTGFAYSSLPTLIMHAVPSSETAAANGLNSVMRTLGSTSSATVIGIILATQTMEVSTGTVPTEGAFQLIFIIAAVVAAASILLALFIPRAERQYEHTASIPVQTGTIPTADAV
jgi:MFS family permease